MGANFVAPKSGHQCEKEPVFGPDIDPKYWLFVSTEGADSTSLYSVLMDQGFKVLKPLNATTKKDKKHNTLLIFRVIGPFLYMVFTKWQLCTF